MTTQTPLTTENPTTPVGGQANEVFTIDSALQPQLIENTFQVIEQEIPFHDIFLTNIEIANTMNSRNKIPDLSFDSLKPLNGEYGIAYGGPQGLIKYFCPWALLPLQYMAQAQLNYDLVFRPIKVNDCRVSLDFIKSYNGAPTITVSDLQIFQRDSNTVILDDVEDEIVVPMDMHHLMPNTSTRQLIWPNDDASALIATPDPFTPVTNITTYIKNRYNNSSIQPDSFYLQVWLRPTVIKTQKLCSPTFLETYYQTETTEVISYIYMPPWVFNYDI